VTEHTWLLDPASGMLVAEGLTTAEASALAGDLLPPPAEIGCARPLTSVRLPPAHSAGGRAEPMLRVARIYHGSVVDGPGGRRSVCQVQGCPIRCRGCAVPQTHDAAGGVALAVADVVAALLDLAGAPRAGVTVLGGEPFFQPVGLAALLRGLKAQGVHTVVYTGYTLEALARRPEPAVRAALQLTDVLIDGPFVAALTEGAVRWRGSRNQGLIHDPAAYLEDGGCMSIVEMPEQARRTRRRAAADHDQATGVRRRCQA
jgi:anaerobic ribonucleoside-triphosphate reductase activating protein